MQYLGIPYEMKHVPSLDPGFIPFGVWAESYRSGAEKPIAIAVQRGDGQITVRRTVIHGTAAYADADYRYVERYMKFLLWSIGGFRLYLCGCPELARRLQAAYSRDGIRAFDCDFFFRLYERELEIVSLPLEQCPAANESGKPIGGHLDGCRIGFDAGGSDRKVSAVIDGKCVYSEEVVWNPKLESDLNYHYQGILSSLRAAAAKMPRVDAIGISSAGVFIGNAPMVSSLFLKVPEKDRPQVKTIYDRAGAEFGNIPVVVANDGDVTALAGAMGMRTGSIMGIAMGTSEAVGYVDEAQNVLGWISELAFAPVDLNEHAAVDEWSTDIGVGCKYFSQDAVIKLAPAAGIPLDDHLTPAEKLKTVQALMEQGDPRAEEIFRNIGIYLAYTIALYAHFYSIRHLMVLGRVMSGKGGETVLRVCGEVLRDEYPDLSRRIRVMLPDEKTRRVGQSVAAASLPELP